MAGSCSRYHKGCFSTRGYTNFFPQLHTKNFLKVSVILGGTLCKPQYSLSITIPGFSQLWVCPLVSLTGCNISTKHLYIVFWSKGFLLCSSILETFAIGSWFFLELCCITLKFDKSWGLWLKWMSSQSIRKKCIYI